MNEEIIKKVEQAKKLLEECLNIISQLENKVGKNQPQKKIKNKYSKTSGEDLHPPVKILIKNNFFEEAKIDLDVVSELQKKLLTKKKPLRSSVVNVMRKMVREGILERTEILKGKKILIAYKKL